MDMVFEKLEETSISLVYNSAMQENLYSLSLLETQSNQSYIKANEIRRLLTKQAVMDASIIRAEMTINDTQEKITYSRNVTDYNTELFYQYMETEMREQCLVSNGQLIWRSFSKAYQEGELKKQKGSPLFQLGRRFSLLKDGSVYGTMSIWFNSSLLDILSEKFNYKGTVYILDKEDNIVYCSDAKQMDKKFLFSEYIADIGNEVIVDMVEDENMIKMCIRDRSWTKT